VKVLSSVTNILLVGVGGQGTILASKILAQVVQDQGHEVKVSEIHGMAQRGGSVVTQVRFGSKVYSPLIQEGEADVILSFERLEALRWLNYSKPTGKFIVNSQVIEPVPVLLGMAQYPSAIEERIKAVVDNTTVVDALALAQQCGNAKASNVVLMGVLAKSMDIPKECWYKALEAKVPAKFLEVNRKAFEAGYDYGS